ncbi:hypothetical protein Csa_010182 [Cucumis sativus]|nr:hypothetical protein Csa_010182 [Cucumis sativus]
MFIAMNANLRSRWLRRKLWPEPTEIFVKLTNGNTIAIKMFVRTFAGETFNLEIEPTATIVDVKDQIEDLNGMQIFVKTFDGKVLSLDLEPTATIEGLKAKLEAKYGVRADSQNIVYAGKVLENHKTLAENNIKNDSALYLVIRLSGGF